jgi:hypothetical protein
MRSPPCFPRAPPAVTPDLFFHRKSGLSPATGSRFAGSSSRPCTVCQMPARAARDCLAANRPSPHSIIATSASTKRRRIVSHQSGPMRCNDIANRVARKRSGFHGEFVVLDARHVVGGLVEFIGHVVAGQARGWPLMSLASSRLNSTMIIPASPVERMAITGPGRKGCQGRPATATGPPVATVRFGPSPEDPWRPRAKTHPGLEVSRCRGAPIGCPPAQKQQALGPKP